MRKNQHISYLEVLHEIINIALDMAQQCQDWDRQYRHKMERDIRAESKELSKQAKKINSIKFNMRKLHLDKKLEDIIEHKKEISNLKIREKYQAGANDSTKICWRKERSRIKLTIVR